MAWHHHKVIIWKIQKMLILLQIIFSLEKTPTQFKWYHSEVLSPSPTNAPMNPTLTRSGGRGHRALLSPGSVIACL